VQRSRHLQESDQPDALGTPYVIYGIAFAERISTHNIKKGSSQRQIRILVKASFYRAPKVRIEQITIGDGT
jgi:hypothetical protein